MDLLQIGNLHNYIDHIRIQMLLLIVKLFYVYNFVVFVWLTTFFACTCFPLLYLLYSHSLQPFVHLHFMCLPSLCSPLIVSFPGVYVEKVGDGGVEGPYTGLLGIGDEILQVNGEAVAGLSLDHVTRLMTRESTASLRIMPARRNQR